MLIKSLKDQNPARLFLLLGSFLFLALFFIYPLIRLTLLPFVAYDNPTELIHKIFESTSIWKSVKNTLVFSGSVTFFSVFTGLPMAWFISRTNIFAGHKLKTWISLPYAIPPFIGAISWIYLANPTNGLINQFLGERFVNVYSMSGLIFVETSFLYTFVFLGLCSALEQMDTSLEEAARTSGASVWKVLIHINLPLIFPALLNCALLVFLAATASFGVPALIGSPASIKVITTEIYQLQKMGTTSGLQMSILLSSLLLVFSCFLLFSSQVAQARKNYSLVTGKTSRAHLIDLGRFRYLISILIILFIVLVLVLPFMGIFLSATSQMQGTLAWSNFTGAHYHRILFETEELWRAFKNSLFLGGTVAVLCTALALLLGYLQTQTKIKARHLIEIFVALPYSAPGTVVALALILTFSQNFFGIPYSIYNTLTMFVLAYTMKFSNFSFKMVTDNYRQIHAHLIEAAQTSGATWLQIMWHIWLPLLKPSLVASFFLVFVPALSELTMSVFLTGPGLETIGTLIYQMQEYSDNIGGGAAVISSFIFVFVLAVNALVKKLSKGQFGL